MEHRFLTADAFMVPDILELLELMGLDDEDLVADEFVVAIKEDQIIGIGRVKEHDDVLELASLGVLEEERGKGLGTAIVKELLALYPGEMIYLATEIPRFFEKQGFVQAESFPEVMQVKLSKCEEKLNCKSPVVMISRVA